MTGVTVTVVMGTSHDRVLTSESGPWSAPGHWNDTNSWQRLWTVKLHTETHNILTGYILIMIHEENNLNAINYNVLPGKYKRLSVRVNKLLPSLHVIEVGRHVTVTNEFFANNLNYPSI